MTGNFSTNQTASRSKILFIYTDRRARYLIEELKGKMNLIGVLQVRLDWKELFFWVNLLLCAVEVAHDMIKKGKLTKISRRMLYITSTRRPSFIRQMSSRIEKHVHSMTIKPDLILQWQSLFAPYSEKPEIPFVPIVDNYTDPPDSSIQKDRLRGWSTFYNESFYQFQKKLYVNAIHIFTLSEWCKEGLSREYRIDLKKITAIGWGPAKEIESKKPSEKEENTILAVGNDYAAKGINILLESAKYLKDFSITIVGKDPAFEGFEIPENVQIKGNVSDKTLIDLYSKAQLFFLFSEFEPAGHVLWEAQACGCVVVGYDAYGISEAVINDRTGILLKTREPQLVAEEIRKLYRDTKILEKMRQEAIENFNKNGTWGIVSQKIAKTLMIVSAREREMKLCISDQ